MNNFYYSLPTQVKFWDVDGDHYVGGIAYQDLIICGCCGGLIPIQDVYEFTPEEVTPIIAADDWTDLSFCIANEIENLKDYMDKEN